MCDIKLSVKGHPQIRPIISDIQISTQVKYLVLRVYGISLGEAVCSSQSFFYQIMVQQLFPATLAKTMKTTFVCTVSLAGSQS